MDREKKWKREKEKNANIIEQKALGREGKEGKTTKTEGKIQKK